MEELESVLRLNKYLANCGVCTRREATAFIKAGNIKVNKVIVIDPAQVISPNDEVLFKDKKVEKKVPLVYVLINKPKLVDTYIDHEENNRPSIMTLLKKKTTEILKPLNEMPAKMCGLVLLTNDMVVLDKFNDKEHKIKQFFECVLDKEFTTEHLETIHKQVKNSKKTKDLFKGFEYILDKPKNFIGFEYLGKNYDSLYELFENLGYVVEKLDRVYYGGLTKKDLSRGWSRNLIEKEIIFFKHFL